MSADLRALAQDVSSRLERWEQVEQARRLRPADLLLGRRADQAKTDYLAARAALLRAARPAC